MNDGPRVVRRRLDVRGQVQGVGFRPFVYRLATRHRLGGSVANDSKGATIEIEGAPAALDAFEQDLLTELPPLARLTERVRHELPPCGETAFRIRQSERDPAHRPEVTPDAATCADCRRELFDPTDRRYGYAFINCTNCGPRYSIIRDVPYDRPQTTMAVFQMCPACQREYDGPADRRFHAQPNACAECGPALMWRSRADGDIAPDVPMFPRSPVPTAPRSAGLAAAVLAAVRLLDAGGIVAIKGIGGYHLACRADREDVVQRLRQRKLRDGKPLALMVPDVETARRLCRLTPADEEALTSPAAPIVLAPKADGDSIAPSVAPGCGDYGVMLPYAPVHYLLFAAPVSEGVSSDQRAGRRCSPSTAGAAPAATHRRDAEAPRLEGPDRRDGDAPRSGGQCRSAAAWLGPLVMTSANLAGQPLTYRDDDAWRELSDVADGFLLHNREIVRPIDDSVVQTFRGEAVPIRRARGHAPRPIHVSVPPAQEPVAAKSAARILAVGGELKATVCLLHGSEAILSEHLGDLTRPEAFRHYVQAIDRLKTLCGFEPDAVACDLHPRYLSTEYARRLGLPVLAVQHHHAHIASVMAEWGEPGPVLGLACDGAGFGPDHAVWGCELLLCQRGECERIGHLEYYPLVGGDAAARETWRPAAALLRMTFGADWPTVLRKVHGHSAWPPPSNEALAVFERLAAGGLQAPWTSSLGRVFDAVAFLLGLCNHNRHEAEAAMAVEAAADSDSAPIQPYRFEFVEQNGTVDLSLRPTFRAIIKACERRESAARIAARFHETLAHALAAWVGRASAAHPVDVAAVSGGCFANRRLLARLVERLEADGRRVLYHRHVPCGDGGLALGQAWVAAQQPE